MSVSAMNARLVLVAALLSTCSVSRETSDDSVKKIYASAGEAVVLPCQIYDIKGDFPTVEWSKEGLGPKNDTFVYRNGCEIFEEKNKDFQFRTSLFMSEVQKGNIALRISNVRPSDAGKHECSIILDKKRKVITTLELIVCAAPEPKLSVVPGDVQTVHCEVHSSLTHLIMRFLDHQEKEIYAEERKRHSSGCFSFTGRVKVPAASDRVTCRVHRPQTNQSRDAQICFTEAKDTKTCTYSSCAVVVVAVGIGMFLLGFFRKELFSYCPGRKIPPDSNQRSVQSPDNQDTSSYLMENETDSSPTSEHLGKMEELELQLQEKERIISVLREELEHSRLTQSPCRTPARPAYV